MFIWVTGDVSLVCSSLAPRGVHIFLLLFHHPKNQENSNKQLYNTIHLLELCEQLHPALCAGRVKKRLWKRRPSLSKGQGLRGAQIGVGLAGLGGLKCGSQGRETFPLWSLAWLWVALQARTGRQQLCTVTHLVWGH